MIAREDAIMFHMRDQCNIEDKKSEMFPLSSSSSYENVICPTVAAKYPKFVCNRTSTSSFPLLSMIDFINFLVDNNFTVLYVGDSLQEQMYHAFLCAVEAEAHGNFLLLKLAKQRVQYFASYFLTTLPPECVVTRPQFNVTSLQNDDWFRLAVDQNVTHIVFNTGAWFIPSGIYVDNHTASRKQTRQCFRQHLLPGSRLYHHLHVLSQEHGVEMIWRDVSPAGICNVQTSSLIENQYTDYYNDFQYYNAVGQNVTINLLKGLVVSDIFEISSIHWREHVSVHDVLHWCAFKTHTVPGLWNSKLFSVLQNKNQKRNMSNIGLVH